METFSTLLAICAGNSPVPGEFPAQRPVTWSFDVFFDLHLNKRLSKQSWGWWFEMLSRPLWCHRNAKGQWGHYPNKKKCGILVCKLIFWSQICIDVMAWAKLWLDWIIRIKIRIKIIFRRSVSRFTTSLWKRSHVQLVLFINQLVIRAMQLSGYLQWWSLRYMSN